MAVDKARHHYFISGINDIVSFEPAPNFLALPNAYDLVAINGNAAILYDAPLLVQGYVSTMLNQNCHAPLYLSG
jgi:hypothetical protein